MLGRIEGGLEHRRGYSRRNGAGEDEGGVEADSEICGRIRDVRAD